MSVYNAISKLFVLVSWSLNASLTEVMNNFQMNDSRSREGMAERAREEQFSKFRPYCLVIDMKTKQYGL